MFELRMTASGHALPGEKCPVRVRVDDPSKGPEYLSKSNSTLTATTPSSRASS
ncbi:MAG TPA: hypothetical protein VFW31_09900 [Candidatus Angelobacter sp.]|nr:hypothetical protein [Candidatus Angelobacter sp.]